MFNQYQNNDLKIRADTFYANHYKKWNPIKNNWDEVGAGGEDHPVELPYYVQASDIDFGSVVINPDGVLLGDALGNETLTVTNIRENRNKLNAIETTVNAQQNIIQNHENEIQDLDQMTTSNLNAIQTLQQKTDRLQKETNGDLTVTSNTTGNNIKVSADGKTIAVNGDNSVTTIYSNQITLSSNNINASITPFAMRTLSMLAPQLEVYQGHSVRFQNKLYAKALSSLSTPQSNTKMLVMDPTTFEIQTTNIPSSQVDPYVESLKPRLEVGTDLVIKDTSGSAKGMVTSTGIFATETPNLSGSYAMLGNNGSLILATTSGNASLSQANLRKVIDFITNVNAVRNSSTSFTIPVDFTWLTTTTSSSGQKMVTINPTTKRLAMSDIPSVNGGDKVAYFTLPVRTLSTKVMLKNRLADAADYDLGGDTSGDGIADNLIRRDNPINLLTLSNNYIVIDFINTNLTRISNVASATSPSTHFIPFDGMTSSSHKLVYSSYVGTSEDVGTGYTIRTRLGEAIFNDINTANNIPVYGLFIDLTGNGAMALKGKLTLRIVSSSDYEEKTFITKNIT